MKGVTIQRVATPTAILVGIVEPLATACTDILADRALRVLRVGHVAAACERIPVVMPQLVVVPGNLRDQDTEMLADRCVAVGAQVLTIDASAQADAALTTTLQDAADQALIRSLRRGG